MNAEQLKQIAADIAKREGVANLTVSKLSESSGVPVGSMGHVLGRPFVVLRQELRAELGEQGFPVTAARVPPELRREAILTAALGLAVKCGYTSITRDQVAELSGTSPPNVGRLFGTMPKLRRHVMREAVRREVLPVIAQGLLDGNPHAKKAPPEVRAAALEQLVESVNA